MKKIVLMAMMIATGLSATAQESVETTVAADVVNQYILRGQDLGNVSLQPTLGIGYKGLSLTAWGSVGLTDSNDTKEFDLTLAYTAGGFNIGVTDYWFNTGLDPDVGNAGGGQSWESGIDLGLYPPSRTFLVGASIKF